MKVNQLVEKDDGSVVFQGVLEGKELAFVVEIGIEALIKAGAIPFTSTNEFRGYWDVHEGNDTEQ